MLNLKKEFFYDIEGTDPFTAKTLTSLFGEDYEITLKCSNGKIDEFLFPEEFPDVYKDDVKEEIKQNFDYQINKDAGQISFSEFKSNGFKSEYRGTAGEIFKSEITGTSNVGILNFKAAGQIPQKMIYDNLKDSLQEWPFRNSPKVTDIMIAGYETESGKYDLSPKYHLYASYSYDGKLTGNIRGLAEFDNKMSADFEYRGGSIIFMPLKDIAHFDAFKKENNIRNVKNEDLAPILAGMKGNLDAAFRRLKREESKTIKLVILSADDDYIYFSGEAGEDLQTAFSGKMNVHTKFCDIDTVGTLKEQDLRDKVQELTLEKIQPALAGSKITKVQKMGTNSYEFSGRYGSPLQGGRFYGTMDGSEVQCSGIEPPEIKRKIHDFVSTRGR